MGSLPTERNGSSRALFLVMCMLFALVPVSHAQAEDQGLASNLQAQNIQAVFDSETETTVISWDNIDSQGGEPVSYTHLTLPTIYSV